MKRNISKEALIEDFRAIGIHPGDVILVRANLAAVGRILGGAETFINALLGAVGTEGTIISLAFTSASGSFITKPKIQDAFNLKKKSYAGALPNAMISRVDALRSKHPMCSYVAIGKYAAEIIAGHDEKSKAYEPVRKIIELNGKNLLIGCVESSPGFTTAHLAEADLGMLTKLPIFKWFTAVHYENKDGTYSLYRRTDPGLCSNSFYKFYALYVKKGILRAWFIGNAYSIIVPSKASYDVEYETLKKNRKFNICESKYCFTCNANRWDRLHHLPFFIFRMLLKRISKLTLQWKI
jgi:aminoglycoside N3'-acetyltransferase